MPWVERLKELRLERRMNQTQAAALLHVDQKTYSDYELGKVQIPVEYIRQLAAYYDVSVDYICGLTQERRTYPKT